MKRIQIFSAVCFYTFLVLFFYAYYYEKVAPSDSADEITPSSSTDEIAASSTAYEVVSKGSKILKFYLAPLCPYEDKLVNHNTKIFYTRLMNMTSLDSYRTNIDDADYCLTSYSCLQFPDKISQLEHTCKKILVVNLQPYASRLHKTIDSNAKYHFLYSNCRYVRKDRDICAPLRVKVPCPPNSDNRQYLVSFKGTIYTSDEGMFRYTMKWLNHTPNSLILFTCNQTTNFRNLYGSDAKSFSLAKECDEFEDSYSQNIDYCSTLNASFVLAPGGRQPASYRFYDALNVGAIPIPYYDRHDKDVPLPFHRSINWSNCTKVFTDIYEVERFILADIVKVRERIENCRQIYATNFGSMDNVLHSLSRELKIVFNKHPRKI